MIALYLIAAHLTGDWLLQGKWMASEKYRSEAALYSHVMVYALCFVPILLWSSDSGIYAKLAFIWLLAALHAATDSHRSTSTLADTIGWQWRRYRDPEGVRIAWVDHLYGANAVYDGIDMGRRLRQARDITGRTLWFPPPDGSAGTPLAMDQSLHILQIAALAAIFL